MFGLSFEKIVLVGIIAAIILGPSRLPHYAEKLGETVRLLRAQVEAARTRAAETVGAEDWQTLDPRQYDPRRIIRDALEAPNPEPAEAAGSYVITGSSGYPRRRFVAHADDSHAGDSRAGDEVSADENPATGRRGEGRLGDLREAPEIGDRVGREKAASVISP